MVDVALFITIIYLFAKGQIYSSILHTFKEKVSIMYIFHTTSPATCRPSVPSTTRYVSNPEGRLMSVMRIPKISSIFFYIFLLLHFLNCTRIGPLGPSLMLILPTDSISPHLDPPYVLLSTYPIHVYVTYLISW